MRVGIWRGRVLWRVMETGKKRICTSPSHPHTQLKKFGISHTHTQSMRSFSIKTDMGSDNTHEGWVIFHL